MQNKPSFIFSADPLNPKKCERQFESEYSAFCAVGFECFLLDPLDEHSSFYPNISNFQKKVFIYRGAPLRKEQYCSLHSKVFKQLWVSPKEYINNYYLSNWPPHLSGLMPLMHIVDPQSVESFFEHNPLKTYMVKDYVKLLKTKEQSIVHNYREFKAFEKSILKYTGFIEGGLVLQDFQEFKEGTETRFFVLNNKLFHSTKDMGQPCFDLLLLIANKVRTLHMEKFFSIDVAIGVDDNPYLIKVLDGQISDCQKWDMVDFVKIFSDIQI